FISLSERFTYLSVRPHFYSCTLMATRSSSGREGLVMWLLSGFRQAQPPSPVFAVGVGFSSLGKDVVKQAPPLGVCHRDWVSSLGNDVVKQANSLRELGNQVT
ncbi:unnamed protein product, partial [Ectocarpus sp. 4 AP-2014]